jgi:copper chaperone CopZ
MTRSLNLLTILVTLCPPAVSAGETTVRFRVTGLFQPDRKDDLIRQAKDLAGVRLADVDYETNVATFAYDPDSKPFKIARPDQVQKHIDNLLGNASGGTFSVRPLSDLPREKLQEVRIGVAGLDCKGCAYAAYLAVYNIDGVERATVSFKDGIVAVWIDAGRTNRAALEAALKKKEIALTPP